ncbi:dihydroorotate dehydrogenase family protein [Halobacteroides halobius DSM 5150]|uniref:Dihydroorotate dehydrogenase B (NAD(+)), catalytic subunit n=1 Tax=Halobacteroides halobius (strain ATCC 35273 / DSM 5150 / MD-1) TaxID=748449 RepID=L0KA83_HALHC|nr:4Fe-4S binding protein [Halobacteroides halobius]AGB41013.1 dihydroorotate dehydrogenase family protein [Halobacteroides halobius DSM 5150]
MTNLSLDLFGIDFANPVMPAAGPPIKDGKAAHKAKEGGAGAIVTKTISVKAAQVPRPNMAEVKSGFINTELWSELSPEQWLEEEYPKVKETGLPVIVGLGYSAEEIKELAQKVEPYADALELSTHYLGDDTSPVVNSIKAAKEATDIPVIVKVSPQVDIPVFAKAAEEAGADGIVLINSFGPTLDIDLKTGKPVMGSDNGYGWLSGDAIFPLALRCVFEAVEAVDIPVIGVGGVSTGADALKMIMAGAQAVQICTAAIVDGPKVYGEVVKEMEDLMSKLGYSSLDQIRGLAHKERSETANFETIAPDVNYESCTGCGLCVTSCVYNAIKLNEENKAVIDEKKCEGCGLCVTRCNFAALSL